MTVAQTHVHYYIKKEILKIYETVEAPNIVVKSALLEKALPNCP